MLAYASPSAQWRYATAVALAGKCRLTPLEPRLRKTGSVDAYEFLSLCTDDKC